MNARMLSANNLPHELLLTTRQTTKLKNAIENNMSTDIKLSKAQISKIIQSEGFLDKLLGLLLKMVPQLKKKSLIPPHPLTNFEIKDYYENEPRFNGVYSRDNLTKTIKNGAYVINLDEYDMHMFVHIGLLCM